MNKSQTQESNKKLIIVLVAVMIVSILIRTVPAFHLWPNFSPIAALALFSGALLWNRKWMFILPVGAMLISDSILEISKPGTGFYPDMVYVYGSFIAIAFIGVLIRNHKKPLNILWASLGGSILFYLVTNFGAWTASNATSVIPYSHDFNGLIQSYVAGWPFFRNTIMSDLLFNLVFFGGYFVAVSSKEAQPREA